METHVDLVAGDATYRVVVASSDDGRSAIIGAAKILNPTGGGRVKLANGDTAKAQPDVTVKLPVGGGAGGAVQQAHDAPTLRSSAELYRERAQNKGAGSGGGGEILPVTPG